MLKQYLSIYIIIKQSWTSVRVIHAWMAPRAVTRRVGTRVSVPTASMETNVKGVSSSYLGVKHQRVYYSL